MAVDLQAMRALLDEKEWELLGFSVDSLTGDQEIHRGIPADKIPRAQWNSAKQFMATFASSLNDKPCSTVTGPFVDREPYDGLWRHVSEGFDVAPNKRQYLSQIIRKGYSVKIDWLEARLVQGTDQQPLGAATYKSLTVRWQNVSREAVQTMAASLNTTPFIDPVINGEKQVGTWYNSGVTPSIAQDGSGIITLALSQQYRELPFYKDSVSGFEIGEVRQQLGLTTETPEPMGITDWNGTTVYALGQQVNHISALNQANAIWTSLVANNQGHEPNVTDAFWQSGILKSQQVSPNPDNSKNIHTSKKTKIHVSVPEFIAHLSEHETVYHSEEKGDPAAPDVHKIKVTEIVAGVPTIVEHTLSHDANGWYYGTDPTSTPPGANVYCNVSILSHDLDDFLTNNYKKSRTVKTPPIPFGTEKMWKVWHWMESATSQQFSVALQRWWVDQWVLYHNYTEYTLQYFKTLEDARAYINSDLGSDGGGTLIDSSGSMWRQTGDFEYEGLKVRHKKSTFSSQTYLEPTS